MTNIEKVIIKKVVEKEFRLKCFPIKDADINSTRITEITTLLEVLNESHSKRTYWFYSQVFECGKVFFGYSDSKEIFHDLATINVITQTIEWNENEGLNNY